MRIIFLSGTKCLRLPQYVNSFLVWHKKFGPAQNIFWASPKIYYLHVAPVTNILSQTKRWFAFSKIGFFDDIKVFEEALNAVKFWDWLKKFGPAQNILGPVKGRGIRLTLPRNYRQSFTKSLSFFTKFGYYTFYEKTNSLWLLYEFFSYNPPHRRISDHSLQTEYVSSKNFLFSFPPISTTSSE